MIAEKEIKVSEADCWEAVLHRDTYADGEFVYAVRSTGIYCRPSCPSRRPKREQVQFFVVPDKAEEAGYRACQRCRPREVEPQLAMVQQVCEYIEANIDSSLTLTKLGEELHFSPHHLQRVFKQVMGISPRQYAEACRLKQLKSRLKEGEAVSNALYEVGYGSTSRLYEQAPAKLGMTPATYRRGGTGMTINYATVDCPLGYLLVAATEKGVCFVSLSDDVTNLQANLQREYPNADIKSDETALNQWVTMIVNYLGGQPIKLDLPVDVQATAFQWRVWEALKNIPYGSTASYSQVAESIGQPTATRAVARACATNPVALVIPCHRVIREGGDLGGYRWGVERKRTLLAQERNAGG